MKSNLGTQANDTPADTLSGRFFEAALIVFVCSFISGTLESAAFRMIAPIAGVSIFLSTGVVGVVLCGMAIGNYWGGRYVAPERRFAHLRLCVGLAAMTAFLIVPLLRNETIHKYVDHWSAIPKIMFWSFSLFFLPSLLLGTISPQVVRLSIGSLHDAGRLAGRLYAWSTWGCIAGILATGWLFIESQGVYRITALCGVVLLTLTIAIGKSRLADTLRNSWLALLVVAGVGIGYASMIASPYVVETKYFAIQVLEDEEPDGREVRKLVLDHLIHSAVDLNDPKWLHYKHEQVQGEFVRYANRNGASPHMLVIGGGAYTLPNWVLQHQDLDRTAIDVVEIDPWVTEIAHAEFGLPRETRIVSHHLDGRQFVKNTPAGSYDLIVQDAVNDFSVPYHLMTTDYNRLIRQSLTSDGVYLLTVIDSLERGPFLRAAVRTMQASFPSVHLLAPNDAWDAETRGVYIIAGFLSDESASRHLTTLAPQGVFELPSDRLARILAQDGPRGLVLTDRHAPVDQLMAGAYRPTKP